MNTCLVNRYDDGSAYVGYHQDRESDHSHLTVNVNLGDQRPLSFQETRHGDIGHR